jgi:drug/metabolite transporter (DMT)-like permease
LRQADLVRLVALGAIWGASFPFMRVVVPALGPIATADARMLVAGIALALWLRFAGFDPQWPRWWRQYAAAGMINTGIPFILFAFAALSLSAGEMAVLNATAPIWAAVMSAALLGERLTVRGVCGLALGIAGVSLIAAPAVQGNAVLPWLAGLAGAACYGFTGICLRRWASEAPSRGLAMGTQLAAGVVIFPFVAAWPPALAPAPTVIASVVALGLVCGAFAYLLYFRLIADVGATGALTVTYLVPLFAMLWGALFLGEPVTASMAGGAALVIPGTLLVLVPPRGRPI